MKMARLRQFVTRWPGVTEDVKWGADHVFSVDTKMFCVTGADPQTDGISFKVDDADFLPMTDRPGIVPAPYLARAKWVQLQDLAALSEAELEACLRRSYELVRAKLTKTRQRALVD